MPLTSDDLIRLARLAQLELASDETTRLLGELNDFVDDAAAMCQADTAGTEPLVHPSAAAHDTSLRLHDDTITESDRRETYLRAAPATQDGLFLVPKVIE